MTSEFGKRVISPTLIPLVALVFVGLLVFAFSRILLAVPEIASTTLAFLLAAEILGIAGVIAATSRLRAPQRTLLLLTGLALVTGGGVSAQIGVRTIEHHAPEIELVAKDIEFDKEQLEFPTESEVALVLVNNDAGIPHNVSVYEDEKAADALFEGEVFNGVATKLYKIPALGAGSYFFRCDVHPTTMVGTIVAGEGGSEPPAHGSPAATPSASPTASPSPTGKATSLPTAGPAQTSVEIVAKDIQFDLAEFVLKANTKVSIEFDNQDAGIPHNVAIYTDEQANTQVFKGDVFNGVETRTYTFTAPQPGNYFFRCDVHPNMKGTAIFK